MAITTSVWEIVRPLETQPFLARKIIRFKESALSVQLDEPKPFLTVGLLRPTADCPC